MEVIMTKFQTLIEEYDQAAMEWDDLSSEEKRELIAHYLAKFCDGEEANEISFTLPTDDMIASLLTNIYTDTFRDSFYDSLEEQYAGMISDKLHEEILYQKDPDLYQKELQANIDSWNLANRLPEKTNYEEAHRFGLL